MGSAKKRKLSESEAAETENSVSEDKSASYEEKLNFVNAIAKPMASRKLAKKLFKLIKKASKEKKYLRHGLKDVQLHIRRGETGLVVFAGDVTPVDIMCHMPAVCEENNIPYVYVPSKKDLGVAMGVNRTSLMVLVKENENYQELYDECYALLKELPIPI